MQKVKGFTLIELLIVVAIIAILAAIAVPNFLEAQTRAKVSRAKADMRSVATALEAYYVDNNKYVGSGTTDSQVDGQRVVTVNTSLDNVEDRLTFITYSASPTAPDHTVYAFTLTTPVSFMTSLPPDPFSPKRGGNYGYWNASDEGWIMWSFGPDQSNQLETFFRTAATSAGYDTRAYVYDLNLPDANSVYNPRLTNPTSTLQADGESDNNAYTYDSTNGSTSPGEVWRVKQ